MTMNCSSIEIDNAVQSVCDYPRVFNCPQSNSSVSTQLSDLRENFTNSDQQSIISSPPLEQHTQPSHNEQSLNHSTPINYYRILEFLDHSTSNEHQKDEDKRHQQQGKEIICQIQDPPTSDDIRVETIPADETAEKGLANLNKRKQIVSELQQRYPQYAKYFLSCQRCVSLNVLRPHCKCAENSFMDRGGCVQMCPDLTKCTKDNRQMSHCPICLHIGKGISGHKTFSTVIKVYVCANCAAFYAFWNGKKNGNIAELKCDSKSGNGNCFQNRQLDGPTAHFCTWCRLKLMQILGFKMADRVDRALQHPVPKHRFDSAQNNSRSNGLRPLSGANAEHQTEQFDQNHSPSVPTFGVEEFNNVNVRKRRGEELSSNCSDSEITSPKKKRTNEFDLDLDTLADELKIRDESNSALNSSKLTMLGTNKKTSNSKSVALEDDDLQMLMLIAKAVRVRDSDGKTPFLHMAVRNLNVTTVNLLLDDSNINLKCSKGRTPIFYAFFSKEGVNMPMINFLVEKGADPFIKDNFGLIPSEYVYLERKLNERFGEAYANKISILSLQYQLLMESPGITLGEERREIMDTVLSECIDADLTDLHIAAENSDYKLLLVLIMRGDNINACSYFGRTALHFAALSMSIRKKDRSASIYQILLVEGINAGIRDDFGFTAADYLRASIK